MERERIGGESAAQGLFLSGTLYAVRYAIYILETHIIVTYIVCRIAYSAWERERKRNGNRSEPNPLLLLRVFVFFWNAIRGLRKEILDISL